MRGLAQGGAGAWESLAPAAPSSGVLRPAQRGRQATQVLPLCAIRKLTLLVVVLPAASGCAALGAADVGESAYDAAFRTKIVDPSKLSVEDQTRLKGITFIESAAGLNAMPKGEVAGLSCKLTTTWQPELNEVNGTTPEEAARKQLLLKAMQMGANAVASPSCKHKKLIDWGNDCFESWACTGDAVLVP